MSHETALQSPPEQNTELRRTMKMGEQMRTKEVTPITNVQAASTSNLLMVSSPTWTKKLDGCSVVLMMLHPAVSDDLSSNRRFLAMLSDISLCKIADVKPGERGILWYIIIPRWQSVSLLAKV